MDARWWSVTTRLVGSVTAVVLAATLAADVAVGVPTGHAAAAVPFSTSEQEPSPVEHKPSPVEQEFVGLVNRERTALGLPRYQPADDLVAVARSWATILARTSQLEHNPRLARQVTGYRVAGENVGYGPDAATVHTAFMDSPSHRANVVDTDYTQVGIAVVTDEGGRLWVAEVFRQPTRD